jgi:trk system potassium uptake protein TrkA
MNIIICGAGEVGRHAAEILAADGHNITIIDREPDKLAELEEMMDVRNLQGSGTHAEVLIEAGCEDADVFIAATNVDEINLLAAAVAAALGARRTIARVHHSAYYERRGLEYDKTLGIDHLVCPEHVTALSIAQTLRSPGALAVERFGRGQVEMQQLPIGKDAPAVGKPLVALDLPRRARLASIERGEAVFIPDGHTQIHDGDVVTLIADVDSFAQASKLLQPKMSRRKHVIILGGTAMGVWLCRALRSKRFAVRLIEENRERAEELAAKLDWVTVLRADLADPNLLEDERVDQADAFVALTGDDEHNVLAAAHAKSMGVPMAVAVQQRSTYMHLLSHVGIDQSFSPRTAAVGQIRELLSDEPIRHLATLANGVIEVFQVRVPTSGADRVIGVPLKDLRFPPKTLVAALQHGDQAHVPVADDAISAGDTVVVIGPQGVDKDLKKMFGIR